ncbi:MAG: DNA-3-methyladenine glycosylase I [Alphaproteobacteria bacterium]
MVAGEITKNYCTLAPGHPWHGPYHESEYGFPVNSEIALFERLCLEINQAGLSWLTVLKKRQAFRDAFMGFEPRAVAAFGARDVKRLMADEGIIRNRLKIESTIDNAGRVLRLADEHGSFAAWIAAHHPRDKDGWIKLFRATFRFMGPEIVNEFLMSIGYLSGAHNRDCPVFARIAKLDPPWMGRAAKRASRQRT